MSHRLWDDPRAVALGATSGSCTADSVYAALDFWVGDWTVTEKGRAAGTNRITKALDGCALVEDWTAADGGKGMSLFFYQPAAAQWRQVWVTGRASAPGGVKEKRLVARYPGGAVRFEGEIPLRDGRRYLDRTTLTPLALDSVRQLIEISENGGASWRPAFDAIYTRWQKSQLGARVPGPL
jgi:hypothetical protein